LSHLHKAEGLEKLRKDRPTFSYSCGRHVLCAHFLCYSRASCVYCRCFSDVKTAVWISIATRKTTPSDLEILVENSGLVRFI